MGIEIHFSPKYKANQLEKKRFNEKIVGEIINSFQEDSKILRKQNILLFFGMYPSKFIFTRGALGFLKIKNTPEYNDFIDEPEIKVYEFRYLSNLSSFKFVIYLSQEIWDSNYPIEKTFTIAHELQHVLQIIKHQDQYYRQNLLHRYFIFKKKDRNREPRELDAIRKAKEVNSHISGKKRVNDFLFEKIKQINDKLNDEANSDAQESLKGDKLYWERIINIDLGDDFSLEEEDEKFWEKYEDEIIKERQRLEKKVSITKEEKDFLYAYDVYIIKK